MEGPLEVPAAADDFLNSTAGLNATAQPELTESQAGVAIITFYLILAVMIGAQSALFWWKKKDKRSYELVTLLGLWLVPPIISLKLGFWRFLLVWTSFSAVTGYMLWQCMQRKMGSSTPHMVYAWFLRAHQVSVAVGGVGYLLLLMELFGLGPILRFICPATLSIMMVWYGLYFGILGRDCAEVAADRMAVVMGTRRKMAVSVNSCGICDGAIHDALTAPATQLGGGSSQENEDQSDAAAIWGGGDSQDVQLPCKHLFHGRCIRGWTIVGKKDVCPVCLEKVDLRVLYANRPWASTNLSWIQMLDAVRYLIVWNPVILIALHFLLHELGLDKGLQANRASLNSFNATAANASLGLNSSSLLSNSTGTVRLF